MGIVALQASSLDPRGAVAAAFFIGVATDTQSWRIDLEKVSEGR